MTFNYFATIVTSSVLTFTLLSLSLSNSFPEWINTGLTFFATGIFSYLMAILFQDRRITTSATFLILVEWALTQDEHTQLIIYQFILFMPAFSIFGIISESFNRNVIIDPVENQLNTDKYYDTGYRYFLARFGVESNINLIIPFIICVIAFVFPDIIFGIKELKTIIYYLSNIGCFLLWFLIWKQSQYKLFLFLTSLISCFVIYISFYSLSSYGNSLPILFGLTLLLEKETYSLNTKVKNSLNPKDTPIYKEFIIGETLSLGVLSGIISSFAIGIPNSILFKFFNNQDNQDNQDNKNNSTNSKEQIRDYWISSSVNSTLGLYLYLIGGMARSGLFDTVDKLNVSITTVEPFICMLLMIITYLYLDYDCQNIYLFFFKTIENINLAFSNNLINIIKIIVLAEFCVIKFDFTKSLIIILLLLSFSFLYRRIQSINKYKTAFAALFPISILPFSENLIKLFQ